MSVYPKTFLYQLNVTRQCNLRCEHCYISSEKKDVSPKWDIADLRHIVEGIRDQMITDSKSANNYQQAEIHLVGGEPTELGYEFFVEAVPLIKAIMSDAPQALKLVLVTNLLTKEALRIAKLFDTVSTSYEPGTRLKKKRHMEMWLENVAELQKWMRDKQLPPVGVTSAITKEVVRLGAAKYLTMLRDYGFKQVHLGFFIPSGDGETNADICDPGHEATASFLIDAFDWYVEEKRKDDEVFINPCSAWISAIKEDRASDDIVCPIISGSLDIDGDGETISCIEKGGVMDYPSNGNVLERIRVIASDVDEEYHYQRSVTDILNSPGHRLEVARANMLPSICSNCEFKNVCKGNCGVLHSQWDGQGECPGYKSFLKHVASYVASQYKLVG